MSHGTTTTRRPPASGGRSAQGRSAQGRSDRRPSLTEQRRRRARRIRRVKQLMVVVLVLALLLTAGWLVFFSSVLATRQVAVSGTRLLSVDTVRTTAAVPLGLPLARQDTAAVARRVAVLAPVDTVTVDRSWPNTVRITVHERTPLVAVKAAGGYVLVDHAGVAFETVAAVPPGVVAVGIDSGNAALLAQAGTVVSAMPAELRDQVATLDAKTADAFRVTLNSGLVITWGGSEQSALKGQVSLLLLKKKPKAIDVSAPHSPAIR